ncbi:biotin--[acetyl-CoA-carboxylase] ligase [Lentilactobacillus kosonis]|uniref:biotin--[biotin carboxyl-carrier protein] ligase n=1 Tax=Lentilactobacillus kosonis TaxID=2810561 RepID=A0A401FLL2_9LACO|nr:biotin--[acetyl-CoA-carboxylase] ligase [Lentilactobacillus kosonis]GAY73196.1 biotin-protein ligase [Lentilactobacillus kosonis]
METSLLDDQMIYKLIMKKMVSRPNLTIRIFDEIDSTNDYLKRLLSESTQDKPMIILADSQTNGYGKRGRSFYSPKGTGIYMSVLVPDIKPDFEQPGRITMGAAVAVIKALKKYFPNVELTAKWVNDILSHGFKIGGILAELIDDVSGKSNLILGIGINLNTQEFPNDLKNKAGAIMSITSINKISREAIIAQIYLNLIAELNSLNSVNIIDRYRQVLDTIGKKVEVQVGNSFIRGIARDIDDSGNLIVELSNGELRHIVSGDVLKVNIPDSNYH